MISLNNMSWLGLSFSKKLILTIMLLKRIGTLKKNLTADNAAIAHYEVSRDIELWQQALENQKNADETLKKSNEKIKDLNDELNVLKSRKKNIKNCG